jgi:hypothetical protein
LGSSLLVTLAIVGCQDQVTAPSVAPVSARASLADASPSFDGTALNRGELFLPPSARAGDLAFSDAASRAINPSDYACSDASPLNGWLNDQIVNTLTKESSLFLALYQRSADLVPTYDALYFGTSATPQTFGYDGEFTKPMVKVERDVKRFWDIPSSEIQVLAMHGSVLLDTARTARTYRVLGLNRATAASWAGTIRSALLQSQTMAGGNYPYWTFNSFAFSTPDHSIPNKIVMGDGILEGYAAIGFGDVAPQAIFAHEFAHQIQYANGYMGDLPATVSEPEQTRYSELMADAMSAYYLTHSRGAAMNQKRVREFLEVFFQIGDCAFTDPGHHGTPNQRLAAATFGFNIADQAQKQGHILTSAEFHALFVAQYPTIVAPDAH